MSARKQDSSIARRIRTSKALSSCLRHKGPRSLRADGFALLDDVAQTLRISSQALLEVSAAVPGEKPRFECREDDDGLWIRATHGHSDPRIQRECLHVLLTEPLDILVHGTHSHCIDSIMASGLRSMGRHDIHFVDSDSFDAITMGFRRGCDRLIFVDMSAAMAAGLCFYRAPDGMIVSPGDRGTIPPVFFTEVQRERRTEVRHREIEGGE